MDHHDVIIVGAGISGVSQAVHLQKHCPGKSFVMLEGRSAIGGTWDLFRYPGIRSDSDMHTLGFSFKPWTEAKSIADGPSILKYVNETVDEFGLREKILLGHRVKQAHWSSSESRWLVTIEKSDGSRIDMSCGFITMCGGYYNYDEPHDAQLKNLDSFHGQVVHPQFWPKDLDFVGKRVLVVGSGATAMTLVPNMADNGAHVTMLQRSPTYVASRPDQDGFANFLRKMLPDNWAYAITRYKNTKLQSYFYKRTRVAPAMVKRRLLNELRKWFDDDFIAEHFTPEYNPWDQRMCLIPNADLYKAIKRGDAVVRTELIDSFVEKGVRLQSGEVLTADIIVTATGLKLSVLSGVDFYVDNQHINVPDTFSYKGMMLSSVPNMLQTFGYINASWTLRADLNSEYLCRLLNHMDQTGMSKVTPTLREEDEGMEARPWIENFPSGYMMRSMHLFPRQGEGPWRNTQDFNADKKMVREGPIEDSALRFSKPVINQVSVPIKDTEAA